MKAPADNRELAYKVWLKTSGNISETARILKSEHSWPVTRPTLTKWKEEHGWEERRAAEKAQAERRKESSSANFLLDALIDQVVRYQKYFTSLGDKDVDNQATYAFTNLVKEIINIRKKIGETAMLEQVEKSAKKGGLTAEAVESLRAALVGGAM